MVVSVGQEDHSFYLSIFIFMQMLPYFYFVSNVAGIVQIQKFCLKIHWVYIKTSCLYRLFL